MTFSIGDFSVSPPHAQIERLMVGWLFHREYDPSGEALRNIDRGAKWAAKKEAQWSDNYKTP